MSVIGGASQGGAIDTGDIGHSLRFRASNSASLTRTITTDATSTYFAAVKRGRLGVISPIFDTNIMFNANDTLTAFGLTTTAVFRDPTSWLFIHVSNGGLYVNGVSLGAVTTSALTNPRIGFDGTNYFDGYIARIGCVSGSSSAYTNFAYLNTESNAWVTKSQAAVKAVVDAGGTNSFMLDFDDGTSLTTLGYDKSSKGNNWTLNNFSLTAGPTYDWMLDTPSNNFATLNPLQVGASSISQGSLYVATNTSTVGVTSSTFSVSSGKWYAEVTVQAMPSSGGAIGVASGAITDKANILGQGANSANEYAYVNNVGVSQKVNSGSFVPYGSTFLTGDVIGVAFDASAGTLEFYKNGISQGVAYSSMPASDYAFVCCDNDTANQNGYFWNFGQRPFAYPPPTGFKALCTANLPEATGAALNPKKHFDIALSTGANIKTASEALFPSNFFEWIKDRGNANNHQLIDTVRGTSAVLQSNTTAAETTYSAPSGSSVGWVWKAGGAPVTNTAGSITSQVSANVEAGFSIVTYTGTGANATVGHGLGVAPKMVIVKNRTPTSTADEWTVYHSALGATKFLLLQSTQAEVVANTRWNNTAPTSSVFSIGTSPSSSADDYVAYCFAEIPGYSKIGSYVGNGSEDGPFVYCGFRPRWLLVKRVDSANDWFIYDAVRNIGNALNFRLAINTADAEGSNLAAFDFTASGFKLRDTNPGWNANGGTYIFMAIAETNFKFANAR